VLVAELRFGVTYDSSPEWRPVVTPPHPWRYELTAPDAALGTSRHRLFSNIVCRIVPIGERPTLRYEPGTQVLAADTANGDDAAVAVGVAWLANHCPLPNVIGESEGRLLTAAVRVPISIFAGLPCFRSVDAEQLDVLAVNFDGIAIDDGSAASQIDATGRDPSEYDDDSE
jgi:hypothetical protein